MYTYKFIEHTADIAVELQATTLEELFICAAEAWKTSIYSRNHLQNKETKKILLEAESTEELLVDFLSEINYFFLTKKWFTNSIDKLTITQDNTYKLIAELMGTDISNSEIEFNEEIKAVTYHQLLIKKIDGNYTTRIVFDI